MGRLVEAGPPWLVPLPGLPRGATAYDVTSRGGRTPGWGTGK